jgi:glycosyltransferase involved in cell wall biosynthesis
MDRVTARAELGWDSEARIALFAANPEVARKRYWLAKDGVEATRLLLPDLHLKIATGISPDRMPLFMNASDCLLLTSSIEGSPNVAKEALMCDLPIVATPAGDIEELLDGVRPSFVCEPTVSAVSAALVECLREPQRSNGREASQRLTEDVIAARILDLYKEIAPDLDLRSMPEPTV